LRQRNAKLGRGAGLARSLSKPEIRAMTLAGVIG